MQTNWIYDKNQQTKAKYLVDIFLIDDDFINAFSNLA